MGFGDLGRGYQVRGGGVVGIWGGVRYTQGKQGMEGGVVYLYPHCGGQYASYWNAVLLECMLSTDQNLCKTEMGDNRGF